MSYPLALHALVIEDDERTKEAYENIFQNISSESTELPFSPAPPSYAFSYDEAVTHLDSSKIFHVVVLDLRLPEKPKMPAVDGVELGINLLARCVNRNQYPIPALLVISAHIGATEQDRLQETVRQGFHYGRPLVKGDYGLLEVEIRKACNEALRYCSVGVHLRDAGEEQYPTINPRDEDLLRRSALQQLGGIGLDLNWWSAKKIAVANPTRPSSMSPWTKVFMGRYLLNGGRGASRPKFFKLMDSSGASSVIESARQVEQKLTHIKLSSHLTSNSCALIVTEKVGAQDARPNSLEYLFGKTVQNECAAVASQIANQVQQLGDLSPESKPLKSLLWPGHNRALIEEQWSKFAPLVLQELGIDVNPISLYSELVASEERQRINERSLVHGDLHISNVALDLGPEGTHAYIFDAGVVRRNVAGRDLAVLEASVILHQRIETDAFRQICLALYGSDIHPVGDVAVRSIDPVAERVIDFVRSLRSAATAWNGLDVYALMVFDFVLIQVGGMAYGSSGNKIVDQSSAACLLAVVAGWYRRIVNRAATEGNS
jgi:CheY-like chemotaxis protein